MSMKHIVTLALLVVCLHSTVAAGPNREELRQVVKNFNREPRAIRSDHPLIAMNYVEYNHSPFAYHIPEKLIRLGTSGEQFLIKKTEFKDDYVALELNSSRGARVRLVVYSNKEELTQEFLDHVCPAVLREVFAFEQAPERSPFVGNLVSQMLHLGTCNHLPSEEERIEFRRLEDATGFLQCTICFSKLEMPPIDGYAQLREESLEKARLYEIVFPPIDDDAEQSRIQALGESIVSNFPTAPQGFTYLFKIVQSELPNAHSFPTGFVYVTDKLISAVEDPAELSFVLAHEIAHVELYKPPRFSNTPDVERMLSVDTRAEYYKQRRFNEMIADLVALHYVVRNDSRTDVSQRALRVLRKLQFGREIRPLRTAGVYDSHPSFAERIAFFDDARFRVSQFRSSFCAMDEDGASLASMHLLGKARDEDRTFLYVILETTDYIPDSTELTRSSNTNWSWGPSGSPQDQEIGRLVQGDGKARRLKSLGRVYAASKRGLEILQLDVGKAREFEQIDIDFPQELSVSGIPGVERWEACEE